MAEYIRRWACLLLVLFPFTSHADPVAFPLRVSENHRYLEDASGKPFLVTGDAAWSLIGELSREEADKYLADRQKRGFNTILVSLIEHRFSRNAPRNFYDRDPFLAKGDFSRPNDAYFDDADWILQKAQERGFLVLLVPSYLGAGGGDEGWYKEMAAAGPAALKSYGRYLGQRFRKYKNIVWVQGGDYNPPDHVLVNAVAEGLAETNPEALQTVHGSPDTDIQRMWAEAKWLSFDTIYTYDEVEDKALERYTSNAKTPFLFIEGAYEGEHDSTEQSLREIAYGALLGGACGQIFGSNPIWHFSGPGLFDAKDSWEAALGSRGAQSISYLKQFFDALPWWKLEPEQGRLLVDPDTLFPGTAFGSMSKDGSLAVIYVSGRSDVAINSAVLAPHAKRARWYDPASGKYTDAAEQKTQRRETVTFEVPAAQNAAGYTDWLLVFEDRG
ncbi:Putative collagen-binding domain of a collagenase [Phyllobacterium sp. CL33Tsu]|uniref:apiosidase-like domain-containing protein n=1 Tax=Phyllobacterium sp. CL33Tsu TaxID=1798191 RepID=UPI0008E9F078|nr:DUF4038 domain-containing protein [Phyllobacterium sp. CL33Tsu]SFI65928.1 Putative collagen-binding domain of a collagenase [Phyllobacterium sp. CL33Tsu]